jgi:hypothetical protein
MTVRIAGPVAIVLAAVFAAAPSGAQEEGAAAAAAPAAAQPEPAPRVTGERSFLDSPVLDVVVDDRMTVATMARAPRSGCPSETYVFPRDNPKWLYQTGRLLQAQREGAVIRISFTCRDGRQTISAIQFLSPPSPQVASRMPTRDQTVRARTQAPPRAGGPDAGVPIPDGTAGVPLPIIPSP